MIIVYDWLNEFANKMVLIQTYDKYLFIYRLYVVYRWYQGGKHFYLCWGGTHNTYSTGGYWQEYIDVMIKDGPLPNKYWAIPYCNIHNGLQ